MDEEMDYVESCWPMTATACSLSLFAADQHPDGWRHSASVGLQVTSVLVDNHEESRDATINGSQTNISYLGRFDGELIYQQQKHSVEQRLALRYGRQRQKVMVGKKITTKSTMTAIIVMPSPRHIMAIWVGHRLHLHWCRAR